jgi:exopolysaccharide biosynthesis polyprenyl glycosylphosphotransferase
MAALDAREHRAGNGGLDRVPAGRSADASRGSLAAGSPPARHADARRLRTLLVGLDVCGVVAVWSVATIWAASTGAARTPDAGTQVVYVALVTAVAVAALASEHLYLARVCAVRAVELNRILHVALVAGVSSVVLDDVLGFKMSTRVAGIAAGVMFCVLVVLRGGYAVWLRSCRSRGRFCRGVVIVGTNEEAADLHRLLQTQPELGYRVAGYVGPQEQWARLGAGAPWLGPLDAAVEVSRDTGAGAMIAVTSLPSDQLNRVIRDLSAAAVHVQVSTGLGRVSPRRFRSLPISHVPLFYIEKPTGTGWKRGVKRAMDVSLASMILVVTAPVIALGALMTKIEDRGPALFRQERVGLDGRTFKLLKLRTMVPDAAAQFALVAARNEREDGPLFKLTNDPRVTRVGRILRATSIDELPQLVNVIRGEMSLVGPRPALPEEVAQFDPEHLARLDLRPGVTGLWQVEARHNPSFHIYRRLDLFYAENWSLRMDVAILAQTVSSVLGQAFRSSKPRNAAQHAVDENASPVVAQHVAL